MNDAKSFGVEVFKVYAMEPVGTGWQPKDEAVRWGWLLWRDGHRVAVSRSYCDTEAEACTFAAQAAERMGS